MSRLREIDAVERAMAIRIAVLVGMPVMALLVLVEFVYVSVSWWVLLIPNLLTIALIVLLLHGVVRGAGRVTTSLLMPRGTPHVREYSEQEALVARGEIAEAVGCYRSLVVAYPDDLDARLRLGELLAGPCSDPDSAEQCYLEIRGLGPSAQQERLVGNALIDLYRSAGRRRQLKAELARFARLNHRTRAGDLARRHLLRLTREDAAAATDAP